MDTFTPLKDFVANPHFSEQREEALSQLDLGDIDPPIVDIVKSFQDLTNCFTLQCCYGHFLYPGQPDPHHIALLPEMGETDPVEYRIAYVTLCIEDSPSGRELFSRLQELTAIDPNYIQFGCAEWFWERQVNSYVLQVEPAEQMLRDRAIVDFAEALQIEKIRGVFFDQLRSILKDLKER